ncbi:MAG: hypothetical protein IJY16_02875 [Clostridia bacterium]|nr:hypothetical protein [Clostridia bacterium]
MPVKIGLRHIDLWNESLEKQVQKYEEEQVEPGQIVFYGPSNFTRWSTKWEHRPLREEIVGASGKPCCINRGFGSSCAEHQLYYYSRMVRPLKPRVLVYSANYGNGRAFGYTKEENWELAQRVLVYAMTDFPDMRIYLEGAGVSQKTEEKGFPERIEYNEWLQKFAAEYPQITYVDKLNYMPLRRKDIYVEDGVHYNQEGYDIYAEFYREILKDELARY